MGPQRADKIVNNDQAKATVPLPLRPAVTFQFAHLPHALYHSGPRFLLLYFMAAIQIIVGSVMGTAIEVAQALTRALAALGHQVRLNPNFQKDHLSDTSEILLICTSNTGMGDLPMNIAPFYHHLKNGYPKLAGRRYGVVNLGDSSYPNFAQAGKTLDEALADLGAQRIGEPLVLDAIYVDDHAAEAREWAQQWSLLL